MSRSNVVDQAKTIQNDNTESEDCPQEETFTAISNWREVGEVTIISQCDCGFKLMLCGWGSVPKRLNLHNCAEVTGIRKSQ